MRTVSLLMSQIGIFFLVPGVLVFAIILWWFFLHRRRAWIGFLAGMAVILVAWWTTIYWLAANTKPCQVGCMDESGVGFFLLFYLGLIVMAIYVFAAIILGFVYWAVVKRFLSETMQYRIPIFKFLIILVVSPILGIGVGAMGVNIVASGMFIPWQPSPPIPLTSNETIIRISSATTQYYLVETSGRHVYWINIHGGLDHYNHDSNWGRMSVKSVFEPCAIQFRPPPLLVKSIQHIKTRLCEPSNHEEYAEYIVTERNIWVWERSIDLDNFPNYVYPVFFSPLLGLLGGLVTVIACEKRLVNRPRLSV